MKKPYFIVIFGILCCTFIFSQKSAASYAQAMMHSPGYPFTTTGVLPSQLGPESYAYLSASHILRQRFYTNYGGGALITTFPLNYYQEQMSKIYSTSSTGVYR